MSAFCIRLPSRPCSTNTGFIDVGSMPVKNMSVARVIGVGMKSCTCCGFQWWAAR